MVKRVRGQECEFTGRRRKPTGTDVRKQVQVVLAGQAKPTRQPMPERVVRVSPSLASKGGAQFAWKVAVARWTFFAKVGPVVRGTKGVRCVAFCRPKGNETTENAHRSRCN